MTRLADGSWVGDCPYALCGRCDAAHSRPLHLVYAGLGFGGSGPKQAYVKPACAVCDPNDDATCPSHPHPGFVTCVGCQKRRCSFHISEPPALKFCCACGPGLFNLCGCRACHEQSRRKVLGCVVCEKLFCSRCAQGGGGGRDGWMNGWEKGVGG